uniref:Small ribosomal subunit protein mS29 n=1 Tax=Parascaris equorum TaxID=6256 RepID=A0A914SCY3_PAREQ
MDLTRAVREIQMSSYRSGRIDVPEQAVALLQLFKQSNAPLWKKLSELKTRKNYEWTKIEKTAAGRPVTDIVEMVRTASRWTSFRFLRHLGGYLNEFFVRLMVVGE